MLFLVFASCDTVIIPDKLILFSYDNSGCMNSDDGDMGYMVYRWGFPYLDYPLDVSISWIQSLSSYNWFCLLLYVTHYLMFHYMLICAHAYDTILDTCFPYSNLLIHMFIWFLGFLLISNFPFKITGHYLYVYAWIKSLDHVHVCLTVHATWPHFMYSLAFWLP